MLAAADVSQKTKSKSFVQVIEALIAGLQKSNTLDEYGDFAIDREYFRKNSAFEGIESRSRASLFL